MSKGTKTEPSATVTTPPSPTVRRYDEAFKKEAVENWIKTGKRGTPIAAGLGVSYPSLKDWKRRYWGDATPERDDLAEENRALKAELARVREQRDIQKASGHLHRTAEERYQSVAHLKAEHSLAMLCAVFDVTDSGYHAWVKAAARARARADLQPRLRAVHVESLPLRAADRVSERDFSRASRGGSGGADRWRTCAAPFVGLASDLSGRW